MTTASLCPTRIETMLKVKPLLEVKPSLLRSSQKNRFSTHRQPPNHKASLPLEPQSIMAGFRRKSRRGQPPRRPGISGQTNTKHRLPLSHWCLHGKQTRLCSRERRTVCLNPHVLTAYRNPRLGNLLEEPPASAVSDIV